MNGALNAFLKRRSSFLQRPIAAYSAVPSQMSASIEAGRPIHISFGSAAPGHDSTPLALATADFAYYTAQRITVGDALPLFSVTETSALPLAFDTLRRAYEISGRADTYNELRQRRDGVRRVGARWYPSGPNSLAFASGIVAMQSEERVASHYLLGRMGIELALMAEAAQRQRISVTAGSDQLAGQAVAYAMADHALIGDEMFAAGSYLGQTPELLRRSRIADALRLTMAAVLVIVAVIAVVQPLLQPGGA